MPAAQENVALHGAVHVERRAAVGGLDPPQLHLVSRIVRTAVAVPLCRGGRDQLAVLEQLHIGAAAKVAVLS